MKQGSFEDFLANAIEIIKERRKELGLTQEQLAKRLGKPQSVVGRFESGGVNDPRISMFFQICQAMDINPAEMWGVDKQKGDGDNSQKLKKIREQVAALTKTAKEQNKILDGLNKLM